MASLSSVNNQTSVHTLEALPSKVYVYTVYLEVMSPSTFHSGFGEVVEMTRQASRKVKSLSTIEPLLNVHTEAVHVCLGGLNKLYCLLLYIGV